MTGTVSSASEGQQQSPSRAIEEHPWIQAIMKSPDISQNSKQQYMRNLERVLDIAGDQYKTLDAVIQSPKPILKRIGRLYKNLQTRKSLVSCIKALFKHVPGLRVKYPEAYETWHIASHNLDKSILDRVASAEPSEREKKNWVPWSEILAKEKELRQTEYASPHHLALAMYCLVEPVRADFGSVLLVTAATPPASGNYLMLRSNVLVLNDYKTSRRYGQYMRTLPPELMSIIRRSIELRPRTHLFVDDSGKPYVKDNSYIKYINRVMKKLFGKNLSISLLRHSFISSINFNGSTPAQLLTIAANMQHSLGMQQMYRRQVETPHQTMAASYRPVLIQPQVQQQQLPPQPQVQQQQGDQDRFILV